jgi:UDP-N-acetylglucosamine 2-epimerase
VQALEKIADESSCKIVLAMRPHPREDAANLRHLRSDRVRIHVGNEGDSREAIVAADLVVGMNSALLVEACYLGCPVVSLQPNLKSADALPTNRRGFSRAAYTAEEVLPALREMLLDESARLLALRKLEQFRPPGDATQRVAELVCSLFQPDTLSTHS